MTDAEAIIASAGALLLDFDGPITALMPAPLNAEAADRARAALQHVSLPDEIQSTTDHLAVLRYVAAFMPAELNRVEAACSSAEVACARRSQPSPEIRTMLRNAQRQTIPVAIVSNNSQSSVEEFLQRFSWTAPIQVLACRTPATVLRLKPDPYLVRTAVEQLDVDAGRCVFVGDSATDVEAGRAVGVRVIGLAKTPQRGQELLDAGAVALIER
ncbi:HAD family hydrolase [Mycolicibacterium fallax]|uniref:HAD family hydrolase n=1 Tax=Mycolicibacterium fallax TaxID=1793 RepID=UPI000A15A949|nr:HAD-IIIA family hydrolase [Mycolicibacterium fallax]BBY99700.1 hydrolase [Mycolicibacterium fallax]